MNKIKKINYFDELLMEECILKYQSNLNMNELSPLYHQFELQARGMLNKEFNSNTNIQLHKEDAISMAIFEIFKSIKLNRFNIEKGKVFPYSNRIIKNTFLMFHQKLLKESCELSIHEFQNDNEDYNDDDIFGYVCNKYSSDVNNNLNNIISESGYSGNPIKINDYSKVNIKNSIENNKDINYVYHYFKSIIVKLKILINNKKELNRIINLISENLDIDLVSSEERKSIINIFRKKIIIESRFRLIFKTIKKGMELLINWIRENYNINETSINYRLEAYLTLPKSLMKKITYIKNLIFKNNLPEYIKPHDLIQIINYIDGNYEL